MLKHLSKTRLRGNIPAISKDCTVFTTKLILTLVRFVGEESYSKGATRDYLIDESPTWCVDPLDGIVFLLVYLLL
jgi:hypothetical protein